MVELWMWMGHDCEGNINQWGRMLHPRTVYVTWQQAYSLLLVFSALLILKR